MRNHFVIVSGNNSYELIAQYISEAKSRGFSTTYIGWKNAMLGEENGILKSVVDRFIDIEDFSADALVTTLRELHQRMPIRNIMTAICHAVEPVAKFARDAGIPFADYGAVQLVKNKQSLQMMLKEFRFPYAESIALDQRQVVGLEYPFIVKPTQGGGSVNVHVVRDQQHLRLIENQTPLYDGSFIAESYIQGKLYSVEAFFVDGQFRLIEVLNRHRYKANESIEMGVTLPSVPESVQKRLVTIVREFCEKIDYNFGIIHVELIDCPSRGPVIIDFNPRLAGASFYKIWEHLHDFEVSEIIVSSYTGTPTLWQKTSQKKSAAIWLLYSAEDSHLSEETAQDINALVASRTGIKIKMAAGDIKAAASNYEAFGSIFAYGSDVDDVVQNRDEICAIIKQAVPGLIMPNEAD